MKSEPFSDYDFKDTLEQSDTKVKVKTEVEPPILTPEQIPNDIDQNLSIV